MFTPKGSTADLVLVGIRLPLLPWQHFNHFRVLKFVGVPQTKPLHRFSPNNQGMFTPRASRADKVLVGIWLPLLPWLLFTDFQVLKFVGVSQPKPLHGLSPNFQDMFTPRGSRAD